jgi:MFS family permease
MIKPRHQSIQAIYLFLTVLNTLATSMIWGINTIFLLDAGLSNAQAFLANAFFTVGQVVFEIPTGIVADLKGRRLSYLLGTVTLAVSTLLYLFAWIAHAPFWAWAASSALLGFGYTFFSGATEAWLVDALAFSGYKGELDSVFANAQSVSGIAMLAGSVAGGLIAQSTDLGVPYILRAILLLATFIVAFLFMKDWGFSPKKSVSLSKDTKALFVNSFELGLRRPTIRWVMLATPFISGVGIYVFYAIQPHLLALYGDPSAYGIAGMGAAIVAGSQFLGGVFSPAIRRLFTHRTTGLLVGTVAGVAFLILLGITDAFWLAILFVSAWGLLSAATRPMRQAYLNALIPSEQRATLLSFDSLLGSVGGVVIQPALGRATDLYSYATSFLLSGAIQAVAIPFALLARRQELRSAAQSSGKD